MDFAQANALNQAIRTIAMRHRALAGQLLGPLGLHPGQEVLLLQLGEQGSLSQRDLASASGCEAPTVTNSLRKLEAAGLVTRRPSPTDGRVTIVELSERGEELLARLREMWRRLAERSVAGLACTSVADLTTALTDLAASLSADGDASSTSRWTGLALGRP